MITEIQAKAISNIRDNWGLGRFTPQKVFPWRESQDIHDICRTLAHRGLLDKVVVNECDARHVNHFIEKGVRYQYKLNYYALEAFHEYAQSVSYNFPWEQK